MANRRYIDFPIAASVGNNDIVLIWQDGLNKQTTKETLLQGSPQSLAGLTDVDISALNNGQILQYNSTTSKWENVDRTDINLSELGDVTIVAPSNGQVLVYNSSTGKWENSSGGYVPYTGAVTTVNLGAQTIQAGSFVKAGGTSAQFLKADGSVDSTAYGTGTVTSVALTMPSAFSVGGSPITTAGTLAVTGAGTVGQYIRGDGSLADFPATTGGGSSVSYYLNGSVSQGTIGGVAYKELNRTPVFGAGTDISINADGYIASFITDALDPNKLLIPGGNWNFETYFSASSSGGSPSFYVELYKYDGTTFTLLATSSSAPELIAFGTNLNPYFSTLAVPETVLALTDRLAVRFYVTHSGRTITLHTEDNHLCQVITTFTTGLTALNGLTSQVQYLTVGTSGTDFAISSASDTHTFNLPTASATNRGALSSADWTTFNGKQNALTLTTTGISGAATLVGSTLNIPQYQAAGTYVTAVTASSPLASSGGTTPNITIQQASGSQSGFLSSTDWTTFNNKQNALTNPVTGTGTTNYLPKFTGSTTIGNSALQEINGNLGLGVTPSTWSLFSGVIELNGGTSIGAFANTTYFMQNVVFNSGFKYKITDAAGRYELGQEHKWFSAPSGTAGNAITFSQPMTLTSGGNLLVGTTTDAGFKLDVNGTGRFINGVNIATTSGNLGIGTSSPTAKLEIQNSPADDWGISVFGNTTTGQSYGGIIRGGTNSSDIAFRVNNAANSLTYFTVQGNGNVGIGTTGGINVVSGWTNFVVNGSSTGLVGIKANEVDYGAMYASSANNAFVIQAYGSSNNGIMAFLTASTERMRITSGGNVGIGETNPNYKLHIVNPSASTFLGISNQGSNSGNRQLRLGFGGAGADTFASIQGTRLNVADDVNIAIQSGGGNVLIGTTTDNGAKLQVNGGSVDVRNISTTNIGFGVFSPNSYTGGGFVHASLATASTSFYHFIGQSGNGTSITTNNILIFGNGNVQNTNNSYGAFSDIKLKENIVDASPKLYDLMNVKIRNYNLIGQNIKQIGVIAQELEEIFPGLIESNIDRDKQGNYLGTTTKSVKYSVFVPMLIKAIQELKQEIDTLKN